MSQGVLQQGCLFVLGDTKCSYGTVFRLLVSSNVCHSSETVMLFSFETAKGIRVLIVPPEVFVFVYLLLAMLNG